MPLRDRLRGALAQERRPDGPLRDASVTALPDLSSLKGEWFSTKAGPGYVIDSWYEGAHCHGSVPLHRALQANTEALAHQAGEPRLKDSSVERFLFIDTETTGLGGAGTMVFLAGVARFEGSALRLRQFILPSPAHEPGLLDGLSDELDAAEVLVSFNGKSFDLPALESRAILSRLRPTWRQLPHLDLLHPSRRLFRGTFPAHRLIHLEEGLLDFVREDDCPSAEVPLRYFRFQATGDPTWILPVLRHNAWDILSLVALTVSLSGVREGEAGPLHAARAAAYEKDWATTASSYQEVLTEASSRAIRMEACEGAARAYARLGNHQRSAEMWRAMLGDRAHHRLLPYVELAKTLEHRLRELQQAREIVERAITEVERGLARPGPSGSQTSLPALNHRRARLVRRTEGVA